MATTEFLINMTQRDIESMSRAELAKAVTQLEDVATKRINRIYQNDKLYSPAANYIVRTGGFSGVRGKDLDQVREEYLRVRTFLRSETSTVKGAKEYVTQTWERLAEDTGITQKELRQKLSPEQIGKIYDTIHRMQSVDASIALDYGNIQKQAVQEVYQNPDISKDELFERLSAASEQEYEESARGFNLFSYFD